MVWLLLLLFRIIGCLVESFDEEKLESWDGRVDRRLCRSSSNEGLQLREGGVGGES